MVTQTISWYHCGSLDLIRHGKAPNGKQKFRCKACGQCSRETKGSNAYDSEFQARVLAGVCQSLERFNNLVRQRLACFVRKTLSFSKHPNHV